MIISANPEPHKEEFNNLLSTTITELNSIALKSPEKISKLTGRDLEPFVRDIMSDLAKGSPFENSIELIGGQKFPDIVARKFYGIEVKTTTQNHWKTTGNSVLENTRVEDVERIFILFAKLADPIEFRYRPYEDCLSEVVVTHSPRYLIDMNLEKGNTIFDKIKTPYDTLRKYDNPIKPIIEYYKNLLKSGEELWWIDQDNSRSSKIVIKIWNNLTLYQKKDVICKAMVYFPELFGNRSDKFGRLSIWLVTREAVVCPNVRDLFTAGGKGSILIGNKTYDNIPRIFKNLINNLFVVVDIINKTSSVELSEYWDKGTTDETKISDWIENVSCHSKMITNNKHFDIKQIINDKISSFYVN
jgi:hypothetical protein